MEQELICNKCNNEMFIELDEEKLVPFYSCPVCGNIKKTSSVKLSSKKEINYIEVVLRKMCELGCVSFIDVDFKSKNYRTITFWSDAQKKIFIKWLVSLLRKDKKAQKAIFGKFLSKKELEEKATMFANRFGWISEEEFITLKNKRRKNEKTS